MPDRSILFAASLVGAPNEAAYAVIDVLQAVSDEIGASPAAVALAWVHGRPGIARSSLARDGWTSSRQIRCARCEAVG